MTVVCPSYKTESFSSMTIITSVLSDVMWTKVLGLATGVEGWLGENYSIPTAPLHFPRSMRDQIES